MLYIITIICFFIVLLYLLYIFNLSNIKGKKGEKKVSRFLNKLDGCVFDNYMINDEQGRSHQIDHILVCNKGIIVCETKNYSGRIYGSDNQLYWTQVLKYGRVKNKFYNPVKQNLSHIYQVNRITKNMYNIYSCVIFVNCNIDNVKSNCTFSLKNIRYYINSLPNLYNEEEQEKIVDILLKNQNNETSNKQHIIDVNDTINAVNMNICPRCGKPLVLRKGKYGDFYGCSGFPDCRFIKKK